MSEPLPDGVSLDDAATSTLGFRLTDVQRQAVESVLDGRDTLLVSPTGSGKSAVYQLAGALADGITVVVSPLLALQEDQVAAFDELDAGPAVAINSLRGQRTRAAALERIRAGSAQFVLLGPEQLRGEVMETLQSVRVDRFVVDEAHCLESWGPDFRPDFLLLGAARQALGDPVVLALTATAAPHVRAEIIAQLRMRDPQVIVADAERRNIDVAVVRSPSADAAERALVEQVAEMRGTGIVYVGTRRRAEELAQRLDTPQRRALTYHGSMPARARAAAHAAFRGEAPVVVVATSAFGLGIDAPHVRFVCHLDAPESIDSYYQEIGRAGRDGEPAHATLHVVTGKASSRRFASGSSVPDVELCRAIAAVDAPVNIDEHRRRLHVPQGRFLQALRHLADVGVLDARADGSIAAGRARYEDVADHVAAMLEERATLLRTRREMMDAFVESDSCRWSTMLGYLGESPIEHCGHCDACAGRGVDRERADPGDVHERVVHTEFGPGQVVQRDGDVLTVLFDHHGYRTLSAAVLEDEHLLV